MSAQKSVVVFDLGGVLIDWNPRYLYRKLFNGDETAMEHFLTTICAPAWNREQDAGRTFAEGCRLLKAEYPHAAELIDAWFTRYDEMLAGPIHGTVEVLSDLRDQGISLYALSNWSSETFPFAARRFDFLQWFNGIVLSGEVRLVKPDPRIYQHFFRTFAVDPATAVFVDDLQPNVSSAAALGMDGILFTDPATLRADLSHAGLLKS